MNSDFKQEILKHKQGARVSLSYQMIQDLVNDKRTPLYLRLKLYFGVCQKYGNYIRKLNPELAEMFEVSVHQIKYALERLKAEGSIRIINPRSYKRVIILTEYIFITDEELTSEALKKAEDLRQQAYGRYPVKDNVYLNEEEVEKLKKLMGTEFLSYITNLDSYIKKTGRKYKDHYATLEAWWFKNQKARKQKKKVEQTPESLGQEFWWENHQQEPVDNEEFKKFLDEWRVQYGNKEAEQPKDDDLPF